MHVLASATSFYQPVLSPGTMSLGFSATAMHWLSSLPCPISRHIHSVRATGPELDNFARHAERDREAILEHRSVELRKGGGLILANLCRDERGRYPGGTEGINLFDFSNQIWQNLVIAHVISDDEYRRMTFCQYLRSTDELERPLKSSDSRAKRARLRLNGSMTRTLPCPFAGAFQEHGDAERFAREYVASIRSWSESTYFNALTTDRSMDERQLIVDRFYDAYEALVREKPDGHRLDLIHCYMDVIKI